MNIMIVNDCQALLIIYINNKLVGGTPLYTCGAMMDMMRLYFVFYSNGTSTVFYSSMFQIMV